MYGNIYLPCSNVLHTCMYIIVVVVIIIMIMIIMVMILIHRYLFELAGRSHKDLKDWMTTFEETGELTIKGKDRVKHDRLKHLTQ